MKKQALAVTAPGRVMRRLIEPFCDVLNLAVAAIVEHDSIAI